MRYSPAFHEGDWGYWGDCIASELYKDDYNIMQFTGLKDDNGKEIFEGDILRLNYGGDDEIDRVTWCGGEGYPAFDLAKNEMETNALAYLKQSGEGQCEVIGNIWENPELISK